MSLEPIRLLPSFREKIWGATKLEPWFRDSDAQIGEVWLTSDENQTEDGRTLSALMREYGAALLGAGQEGDHFPILVKFIFTTGKLSIQVHPDDARARAWEGSAGKTEMWHMLRAETGASIALGFREPLTRERLRESALSGEIENLVRWLPVRAGETFITPAGVVHAIGAGLALVEIQQNSDVNYRLYDYGRPRELHLERGVAVADLGRHPGPSKPVDLGDGRRLLACCEYFAAESIELAGRSVYQPDSGRLHTLIVLEGAGSFGDRRFGPGEVWLVPASAEPFPVTADAPARLLRTFVPRRGGVFSSSGV
jgi:mannose-6-phosphate isomerase